MIGCTCHAAPHSTQQDTLSQPKLQSCLVLVVVPAERMCMLIDSPELQIIQLYEMIIVRHGLMLVGAPFSGKSVGLKLLAGALSDLHADGKQGTLFEKVEMRVINPKSVTMGQLYGEVDKATQEWKVCQQQ